jgi:acyl dehydratase
MVDKVVGEVVDGAAGTLRTEDRKGRDPNYGTIAEEGLERLRARIGVPVRNPSPPHYREPGLDAFRIVAQAYGDDNPLWSDPEYAAGSRWGAPIAPPALVGGDTLIGEDEDVTLDDAQRALLKGDPLRGVHAFYSGSAREWWAPLPAGNRVRRRDALVGVHDKQSEFAGRAVHEWSAQAFALAGGPLLAAQYKLMIRTERTKARERKKYAAIEPWTYTDAAIERIEKAALAEERRGATPRYWEDVAVGDPIGSLVKGPLTVTDMVCWHVGMGMGLYNIRPLGLAVRNRRRIPGFYHRDERNVPDVMQRVHWDPAFARQSGNPTTFDYGRMRETWLVHACTNWMGDDAWLWKLECEFRAFNYVGDTQWVGGEVTRQYLAEGDRPAVDVALHARSQREVETTVGRATILLPSREHGAVRLPDPPGTDLESAMQAIVERFAR